MEGLSDDLLVSIFQWLRARDLFRARVVCRRWSTLALHRRVWENVALNDILDDESVLQAVLRLAPSVGDMSLFLHNVSPLLKTTSCAATRLSFSLWDERAGVARQILKRQLELGHLRELHLHMHGNPSMYVPLLEEISKSHGLIKLHLQNYRPTSEGEVPLKPRPSSLLELRSDAKRFDRFTQFLLFTHCRTLERLSLRSMVDIPVRLLTFLNMALLRELECPPLNGMDVLAQCPALRSLTIVMEEGTDGSVEHVSRVISSVKDTTAFLKKDNVLRELKLYPQETVEGAGLVKRILLAPSSMGESALTHLEIGPLPKDSTDSDAPQRYISRVLQNMPQLRSIILSSRARSYLLTNITPETVPHLEVLGITINDCAHSYAHRPEVTSLLHRNAHLHLLLRDAQCVAQMPCPSCRQNCHAALRDITREANVGLFAHAGSCNVLIHKSRNRLYTWARL